MAGMGGEKQQVASGFEASLGYRPTSRTACSTQRNDILIKESSRSENGVRLLCGDKVGLGSYSKQLQAAL